MSLNIFTNKKYSASLLITLFFLATLTLLRWKSYHIREQIERCEVITTPGFVNDTESDRYTAAGSEKKSQTFKCSCKHGKVAGTSRGKPACVPAYIFQFGLWCDMQPCLKNEECRVSFDKSGWRCLDQRKTTVVRVRHPKTQTKL